MRYIVEAIVTALVIWLAIFGVFEVIWPRCSHSQVIPQYSNQDWISGRATAEIEQRQRQEYERIIAEQRRLEEQNRHNRYEVPRYDPKLSPTWEED